MSEFQNKNDYSVIVYGANGFLCKYTFVGNLYKFSQFLDGSDKFGNWLYFNVYVRRSGTFLRRFKRGEFIPAKPRY